MDDEVHLKHWYQGKYYCFVDGQEWPCAAKRGEDAMKRGEKPVDTLLLAREALLLTEQMPMLSVDCVHDVAADPNCVRCRFYKLRSKVLTATGMGTDR